MCDGRIELIFSELQHNSCGEFLWIMPGSIPGSGEGERLQKISLDETAIVTTDRAAEFIALDDALDFALARRKQSAGKELSVPSL